MEAITQQNVKRYKYLVIYIDQGNMHHEEFEVLGVANLRYKEIAHECFCRLGVVAFNGTDFYILDTYGFPSKEVVTKYIEKYIKRLRNLQ